MIKNIYYVRVAKNDAEFAQLERFFSSLGLDRGTAWQGRHNKGVLFRTPQAGIEVFSGDEAPPTDLVLEVANADSAYDLCRREGFQVVEELADQRWGGRMFVVEAAPGKKVSVFSDLPEHTGRHNREFEGKLDARGKRFGIVVSRFNSFITDRLTQGALDALRRAGVIDPDIEIVRVPGAFEIPSGARTLAQTGRVDAVICIGCLIRGETTHYEHIAEECTRGIGQSAQDTGVPHAYGVLTCENLEQAIDRAGLKSGNKGFEAAMAAVEMANLKQVISHQSSGVSKAEDR
jgi:6,7-dimethyl-8-ribityllumazine synthase